MNYRYESFSKIWTEEIDIENYSQLQAIKEFDENFLTINGVNSDYTEENIYDCDGGWAIYGTRKRISERLKGYYTSRGENSSSEDEEPENNILLGFVIYSEATAEELELGNEDYLNIDLICVSKILSKRGYGNMLMQNVFQRCIENEIKMCTLQALEMNDTYFEKYGFQKIYDSLNSEGLWDMVKFLD